ncbi:MAG: 50S ribosomal protein L17 [Phycisphaerales bacterium]|nr:50S ribosomal protein L17 [Phycisphaerales bacterium]
MRHRKAGYKLGRTTAHRTATLRNLAASLLEHGQIVTTLPRAKAVQPFVEKLITTAKKGSLHARRQVIAKLGWDRPGFEWLYLPKNATEQEKASVQALADRAKKFFDIPEASKVERNRYGDLRKAPKLVKHIFDNVVPRFRDRAGGYTRVVKLGRHRIGDGGEMVVIQFVGAEEGPEIGGNPSSRRRIADRRTAFAAKIRKAEPAAPAQA